MRILLVTQYFYPENFKSNDIAFELAKKGYDVTVLTGIPNYPDGKFYKGYGIFKNRIQKINGVKVKRALLFSRGNGSKISLALNYLSWTFFASIWAFFLSFIYKYDAIIVHEPSPITQGIPAIIVKKIQKIPMYFWVLDLWPESLISIGGVKNFFIISFFEKMVVWIYNNSDKILISSQGFKTSILEKGDYENKLIYFPNWAEDLFNNQKVDYVLPEIPDGFIIMFAGNIGEAQDFDNIMETALLLKDHNEIQFVFVGDGRKKKWVDDFVIAHNLYTTVHVLGRFPIEMMPIFFGKADVMLLSLKDELIFNLTVPAKLQAYMAAGKPVVAMLNGEGANVVNEAECGFSTTAGNSHELAMLIMKMFALPKEELVRMGKNAKCYFDDNFSLDKSMNSLINIINKRIY